MKKVLLILTLLFVGCSKKEANILEIKLEADESTGYSWSYVVDNGQVLEETNNEYIPTEKKGMQVFNFKSLKPGTAKITLSYIKNTENIPLYEITYDVIINENGLIESSTSSGTYINNEIPEAIIR